MKPISTIQIEPPPEPQRVKRNAQFRAEGSRKTRYHLPDRLESSSPIGYRTRVPLTQDQANEAMTLLSMDRPTGFAEPVEVTDGELFDEVSLGILSARQSTNFRGFRQVSFGPKDSQKIHELLGELSNREAAPIAGASHTHLVLGCPYRNPFTMLLTLVGHSRLLSAFTVGRRIFQKRVKFADDIPTIGYLPHLHTGILADAMERAAVIASNGARRALALMSPFCGKGLKANRNVIRKLEKMCGITTKERFSGWGLCLAVQVGQGLP